MSDVGDRQHVVGRRGGAALGVGLATVVVAALCLLGTGNVGGYLVLSRVAGHPEVGTVLTASGCVGVAFLVARTRRARLVAAAGVAVSAACCLQGQVLVGEIGWRPAQHVLADSPDGRVSVMAYEYRGLADNWIEFRLRSHAGWRSREVCLDRVADAAPWMVAARFVDAGRVELTWVDGPQVNTWVLEVDPGNLRVRGASGCRFEP